MTAVATSPTPPTQSLAERVSYVPMQPMGSVATLKGLVLQQSASLAAALPKHVTPERLLKTMLTAVNRNPKLLECTQSSVMETISRAAELGLDLSGTLGEAYPVPFNNKVGNQWVSQCQLIIGYRGLAKLARQSGDISTISADVVCEHDSFIFRKGSNGCCEFTPNLRGDRGRVYGAFAHVKFKDGSEQYDFMPCSDINAIRRRSKSGCDREGNPAGPWKTDWEEMAKKTVFRRLAKWLPLSAEKFKQAVEQDSDDYDINQIIDQAPEPKAKEGTASDRLLNDLTGESAQATSAGDPVSVTTDGEVIEEKDIEAARHLRLRWRQSTPRNKGETEESWDGRFFQWINRVASCEAKALADLDADMIDKGNITLDELNT